MSSRTTLTLKQSFDTTTEPKQTVWLGVRDAATSGQREVGGLLLFIVLLVALPFVFFFCHVALRNARRWHRIDPQAGERSPTPEDS